MNKVIICLIHLATKQQEASPWLGLFSFFPRDAPATYQLADLNSRRVPFSFFEGQGSTGMGGVTTGRGAGGGTYSATGGAGTTGGRTPGHEQPAVQTIVMSKHIR